MLQYPYPIRLTPIWGKTMRQLSERFYSCRTQQEYTQVGIKIFRFFRTEGSNRFPDRRRIPTCEARHGDFGQPRFRRLDGIAHGMIAFCRRRCSFPQFVGTAKAFKNNLKHFCCNGTIIMLFYGSSAQSPCGQAAGVWIPMGCVRIARAALRYCTFR